ncbi:hypothetical protein SAY87_030050 [Trapa incisa]|uniref:Uncharacterized protein n=1 Tax=Trapa incisa TaxID=236973 RepID=A0AAN7Q9R3_9MYRT|nr:hypothetical protein SAY87_030050 [Trapa incisa]
MNCRRKSGSAVFVCRDFQQSDCKSVHLNKMGRVRGKGKKQVVTAREDRGSGEEKKILTHRKRGRPHKIVKGYTEDDADKVEENGEALKDLPSTKDANSEVATDDGRKRIRHVLAKEIIDSVKEENSIGAKMAVNEEVKVVGFRQIGSRRKNKPRRAAEVGVECK